jgi:hypothetical protein
MHIDKYASHACPVAVKSIPRADSGKIIACGAAFQALVPEMQENVIGALGGRFLCST